MQFVWKASSALHVWRLYFKQASSSPASDNEAFYSISLPATWSEYVFFEHTSRYESERDAFEKIHPGEGRLHFYTLGIS